MDIWQGGGLYWRIWLVNDANAEGGVRDVSSWVFVKDVSENRFWYRLVKKHDGKYWLGETREVDKTRFMQQLSRKATGRESYAIWESIKSPLEHERNRQLQQIRAAVSEVCGQKFNSYNKEELVC